MAGDDPYRQAGADRLGAVRRVFSTPRRVRAVGLSYGPSRTALIRLGSVEVPHGRSTGRAWTRTLPGESIEVCARGLRVRARTGVLELVWEQIAVWRGVYDGPVLIAIELGGAHGEQLRFGREVRELRALLAMVETARGSSEPPPPPPSTDPRRCVVCLGPLRGEAIYANAWERVRKKLPCCSHLCGERFDPDLHWIPAPLPALAGPDEQPRLRTLARTRLINGDEARPVVRELLCAGLNPTPLRALVAEAHGVARAARAKARRGMAWLLLLRLVRSDANAADARTDASFADAVADLDAWEARAAER